MPTEFDHVAMLSLLRDGYNDNNDPFTLRRRALDAAIAALQAQHPGEPMFTASMYGSAEAASKARAEWEAQQPGAQAPAWIGTLRNGLRYAHLTEPVAEEGYYWEVVPLYLPPSIPEPSAGDVELAWSTLRSTTQPRDSCACDGDMRAVLTAYTARLRERIGQAPGGDGDA